MKQKNQKGFTLVLSLVLLVVMSIMGGALIVISASDHQSNNNSDNYQQTFYVAETALLEGEKYVINNYLGKWDTASLGAAFRDRTTRKLPADSIDVTESDCYRSFPNTSTIVGNEVIFQQSFSFGKIFTNVFPADEDVTIPSGLTDSIAPYIFPKLDLGTSGSKDRERIHAELEYLNRFNYEFFIDKLGAAPFVGFGTSIKKGAQDSTINGVAFRVYGCGIYSGQTQIIVPLESVLVLPSMG